MTCWCSITGLLSNRPGGSLSNRNTDNPFAIPNPVDSPEIVATPVTGMRHRGSDSFILGAFGAAFCGLLFSVGYVTAVLMLEAMFVPPLTAANFGQFGLLVISLGVAGAVCGLTFAMIPFLRFSPAACTDFCADRFLAPICGWIVVSHAVSCMLMVYRPTGGSRLMRELFAVNPHHDESD